MEYVDVAHVKRVNKLHGGHWFEASTMQFFHSKVGRLVYGGKYFISSEYKWHPFYKKYSVRCVGPEGHISTVGEFNSFPTWQAARREIDRLMKESNHD